ncbi:MULTISPECIES: molybdate ABC transporter permease subunit [Novosphingobium]|uniref:molybdate ABC transporter permease subunit n=1 Tax=Novosphingobium TaxID=165696 RepID=UPI0022F25B87|nr:MULTISPECIES: molybdate ABC transporter permease subunit [Novosphingobium]GLK42389.1 molybdate ABC transporter permease [Novosphingobium resinovorum]
MNPLSSAEWEVLVLSLKVGAVAMSAALPVAFAFAWVLARWRFPGKVLVDAMVHLPLVLPPVVTGWLLLLAFSPNAPLGGLLERAFGLTFLFRWTGAALAAAIMALPLMVRAMRLSLEGVDRRLENAARTLGAGSWRTFVNVTLPLSLNGVLAALVLGFARSVGEFGATITFASNIPGETQTLPLAIYSALQVPGSDLQVARLAGLSVMLSVAALVLSEWLARRSGQEKGRHVI